MKPIVLLFENTRWTRLADKATGQVFYKQIVKYGKWADPYDPAYSMTLDFNWGEEIIKNFEAKISGRVPVPLSHTDQPEYNTGECIGLENKKDGLYAKLDIRDEDTVKKIENGLIFDVSVSFDNGYIDKKTGDNVGPTLLHVALVNNPYLKGMSPFQALSESLKNKKLNAIMLSEERNLLMLVNVKNGKEYDVKVVFKNEDGVETEVVVKPGEEVEVPADQEEAVKAMIEEAEAPKEEEKPEEGKEEEKTEEAEEGEEKKEEEPEVTVEGEKGEAEGKTEGEGGAELSEGDSTAKQLAEARRELAKRDAEDVYSKLLSDGKITPAQKDLFMLLSEKGSGNTVSLSEDKTVSFSEAIAELLNLGSKKFSFDEEGKDEKKTEEEGKPSSDLDEAQKRGMDLLGVKPEEYDEVEEARQKKDY